MEQNQNQQQEQEKFVCTGNCLKCRKNPLENRTQWQYCASQHAFETMRMVAAMQSSITAMQGTVNQLQTKIEAIQNSEVSIFDPTQKEESITEQEFVKAIAQSGDGAE